MSRGISIIIQVHIMCTYIFYDYTGYREFSICTSAHVCIIGRLCILFVFECSYLYIFHVKTSSKKLCHWSSHWRKKYQLLKGRNILKFNNRKLTWIWFELFQIEMTNVTVQLMIGIHFSWCLGEISFYAKRIYGQMNKLICSKIIGLMNIE